MKIIAVIPARFNSSRFEGKPLASILGVPMVVRVYNQVKKVSGLDDIVVATDDERIRQVCVEHGIPAVMTSTEHKTHIDRLYEVSTKINADFYININGDEPLIEPEAIERIIPNEPVSEKVQVFNLMTPITNPLEAVDTSKIKIATDVNGYALYLARYPIPFPKGSYNYVLYKFVGVQCFNKAALEFANSAPRGIIEATEDIDEFRFIENGEKIKFISCNTTTLSVDTPKDVKKVEEILLTKGEFE